MSGRRTYLRRGSGRKLVGLLLVLSLCASIFPLPMGTVRSPEKDQSQPFPCQNRPCGCASAEQCWKQCCCFTNAEKLVWARENGVTPPGFVVEAAESEAKSEFVVAKSKKSCRQCVVANSRTERKSCCDASQPNACSSSSACCEAEKEHTQVPHKKSAGAQYVIVSELLKCRGQGHFWSALPWAVIPVSQTPVFSKGAENWDHPQSELVISVASDPPEPPPRLV